MTPEFVAARRRVVGCLALVLHVAEQMPLRVLRPRLTEMHPDAPVDPRRVLRSEPPDVERCNSGEAPPVDESICEVCESW